MAGSLLRAVGLPELITHSLADYEAKALALAQQPEMLRDLRQRLAERRCTAPVFDTDRCRRSLESAYIEMWERRERGQGREGFAVPAET
jgi:predicted O-linked N-acetylglucosamine transferase (SPINDLY family)